MASQWEDGKNGRFRRLEINGGQVHPGPIWRLWLPPVAGGYADAQIDDYGHVNGRFWQVRRRYPWRPGVRLRLRARFSHPADRMQGTAGFGFWNAPFGDPTVPLPALPQATWFFFASPPNDLPFPVSGPGRGWFAGTVTADLGRALPLVPLALPILLLNQLPPLRRRLWPWVRRRLGISFAPVTAVMTEWHDYELRWQGDGCTFLVDGETVLATSFSPSGPLGFVCWVDNQYLVLRRNGRVRWGTLVTDEPQWLEVADLQVEPNSSP